MVVINRDVNQQGQSSDITININNHINFYPTPQTSDDNHLHSTTDMNNGNQEEEEDTDKDDDKTITEHESDDSDNSSNYQTPPTSDHDNADDKLD